MKGCIRVAMGIAMLAAAVVLHAEDAPAPVLDGSSQPLAYEVRPRRLAPATQRTTVEFSRDAAALRVHVVAIDPEPARIVAQQARFDAVPYADDAIKLSIVPREGGRDFEFRVNAAGARADAIWSSAGDSAPDWNGDWSGRATRTATGYEVDFVIPFATLGLDPATIETAEPRVNVLRRFGRERGESLSLAPIDTQRPCNECQYLPLALAKLPVVATEPGAAKPSARWRVQPSVVATSDRRYDTAGAHRQNGVDAGVDARYTPRPGDAWIATLHPDFAQVELDSIQFRINTRYVLGLPERRPFFTTESGVFGTPMSLLYTRSLVDPDAGLQFVRHRDDVDAGVLYVRDSVTSFVRPGVDYSTSVRYPDASDNLAARYRQRLGSVRWGLAGTLRSAGDYGNGVAAADVQWDPDEHRSLTAQLAVSTACDPGPSRTCTRGGAFTASHRYGRGNWTHGSSLGWYGDRFRADLGFIDQAGVRNFNHYSAYERVLDAKGRVQSWDATVFGGRTDALHRGLLSEYVGANAGLTFGKGSVGAGVNAGRERVDDAVLPNSGVNLYASVRPSGRVQLNARVSRSRAIDYGDARLGTSESASVGGSFKPRPWIDFSTSAYANCFDLPDRPLYRTMGATLRGNVHFGERHHASLFLNSGRAIVHDQASVFGDLDVRYQLTYQYKPSAFRYLIAGVSGDRGRADGDPAGLQPRAAFAFLKYVHDITW